MQELPFHWLLFLKHGRTGRRAHRNAGKNSNTTSWIVSPSSKLSGFGPSMGLEEDADSPSHDQNSRCSLRRYSSQRTIVRFQELPIDILEVIFQWVLILSRSSGASLCRVSRAMFELTAPILYHDVFLRDKEGYVSFVNTLFSHPRGVAYASFVRELHIPNGVNSSQRISLPYLQRLSIPHFSSLNLFEELSNCQSLILRSREATFEEIPSRVFLPCLTHLTLPARWNMRGIVLNATIMPSLIYLALPISVGVLESRHLVVQDQRHFLNVINSKFNLEKIILLPWRTTKGEVIGVTVDKAALLADLEIDPEDSKYAVITYPFGDTQGENNVWDCTVEMEEIHPS